MLIFQIEIFNLHLSPSSQDDEVAAIHRFFSSQHEHLALSTPDGPVRNRTRSRLRGDEELLCWRAEGTYIALATLMK
jgi:hypothetical protein